MKVVLLCQYFQGPGSPGIPILYDLAQSLRQSGHDVTVVAGRRGYMDRAVIGGGQRRWRLFSREVEDGVNIIRPSALDMKSRSKLARLLGFLSFSVTSLAGLMTSGRADVMFGSSPPLFLMPTGWLWARLTGASFILEVRDLWPESAQALGVIRSPLLLWLTGKLALFLYRRSDAIVALTEGIAEHIRKDLRDPDKVVVSRYALDPVPDSFLADQRQAIRQELGWARRCIAIYTGTLGYANNVDLLLTAAARLRNRPDLQFVIIGDGVNKPLLQAKAISLGLENFSFVPPVPQQEIVRRLVAADLGLVSVMKHPLFDGAIPTKMLEYMAAGLPVIVPQLQEMAAVVRSSNCGQLYDPESAADLAKAIDSLAAAPERRAACGIAGRTAIARDFAPEVRNRQLEDIILALGKPPPPRRLRA